MTQTWKVTWNSKFYDFEKLINDYKNNNHSGLIYQSKGNGKMKNLPKISDNVYISCNKLKIMKCKIITNFITGREEESDIYNIGEIRKHTDNNKYLVMKIVDVYENPEVLKGNQRTWCKYIKS